MALELVALLLLVAVGVGGLLSCLLGLREQDEQTQSERPVLPAHYSSLLNFDPKHYPGHCTSCGTDNEPGYRYCENCGSRIPTSRDYSAPSDPRRIFNE